MSKLSDSLEIIGGLSKPSKMPWYGWSIPAKDCKIGSKLAKVERSVCSKCYALKGMYNFPNVQHAMEVRLMKWKAVEYDQPLKKIWEGAFITALTMKYENQRGDENRFRWFDSGDLQSPAMLKSIVNIADKTPMIRHYLPTKEKSTLYTYLRYAENPQKPFPDNLVVRLSAPMIGELPKNANMHYSNATVGAQGSGYFDCIAPTQNNMCGTCDMCWRKGVNVNYALH